MKKFSKTKLLLSSVVIASMLLTVGNQVKADSSDNNSETTNTLTINNNQDNSILSEKAMISPVASRDDQTLRQVAIDNNTSLDTLEKLNDYINPDKVIPNGTQLYLPQNVDYSSLFTMFASGLTSSQHHQYYGKLSASERAAKYWIAKRESGYSYTARNGKYYGRFQLNIAYLHGNLSPVNQERTADRYVKNRYGSWVAAKRFWERHGWY